MPGTNNDNVWCPPHPLWSDTNGLWSLTDVPAHVHTDRPTDWSLHTRTPVSVFQARNSVVNRRADNVVSVVVVVAVEW